jgi:hypothetical protein
MNTDEHRFKIGVGWSRAVHQLVNNSHAPKKPGQALFHLCLSVFICGLNESSRLRGIVKHWHIEERSNLITPNQTLRQRSWLERG